MFELSFKKIDQILRTDSGSATELDYVEQTSWILFLKYLDDLEQIKKTEAELAGKKYKYLLDQQYRWDTWAVPKTDDGKIDHQNALDGDDLKDFVNDKLFPYLRKFRSEEPNTIEYKIGEIFSELKNKISSGYKLREILNTVDTLRFQRYEEKHELSHLYEDKIKNMGNAGRNGGEYYTPRPLIGAIVEVVDPEIGKTVYDGACGSAGFLVEAFEYMKQKYPKRTTAQDRQLQQGTFYGKEIKSLAYIIGVMNMILHGIEAPNIKHVDTLARNINDIQDKDRYDYILANPPFGAGIGREIQQNFPVKTGETALLFLQHFIKSLKAGGKAGIVIKSTFLSNTDAATTSLRKQLLENCDLHTILDLPKGAFVGTGEKTVVLFFNKGNPTREVWYYQLDPKRTLGKKTPLNASDLKDFLDAQKNKDRSENSWVVEVENVDKRIYDLGVRNPHKEGNPFRNPKEIVREFKNLDKQKGKFDTFEIKQSADLSYGIKPLGEVLKLEYGKPLPKSKRNSEGKYPVYGANGEKARTNEFYFDKPSIIIGRKGSAGELNLTENKFWPLDVTYFVTFDDKKHDLMFIYYLLKSMDLHKLARGIKPGINRNDIYALRAKIPPLEQQRIIAQKLSSLSKDADSMEKIYHSKINLLTELKDATLKNTLSESVPSPFIRNQVHAAIIEKVRADGGSSSEVAVAKYDHILQEVFGLSLGYEFGTHKFGPFDGKIKNLIYSGLGRNHWFGKNGPNIVVGSNINALIQRQSNLYRSASRAMNTLSELNITKLNTDKIELLSTICHAIKVTNSVMISDIRDFMEKWPTNNDQTKAQKFSLADTEKCLGFILDKNLHQKLLI